MEKEDWGNYEDDNTENGFYESCPKCGREYDHIDFDFQLCSYCGHDADEEKYIDFLNNNTQHEKN